MLRSGRLYRPRLAGPWAGDAELARVLPPFVWLSEAPRASSPDEVLVDLEDEEGRPVAPLVYRRGERLHAGADLATAIRGMQQERYREPLRRPLVTRLPFDYNLLPHWLKGALQPLALLAEHPKPLDFPHAPFDLGCDFLAMVEERLCGRAALSPWPDGAELAICLSHDVDTSWILRHPEVLERITRLEAAHGFRSTWHLTASYLEGGRHVEAINGLTEAGHEIASHGDNHDARHPFEAREERRTRWERIRRTALRFDMKGIRSAWLTRTDAFFDDLAELGIFHYDSSVPNSSPVGVGTMNTGCASMRPYLVRRGVVEIPLGTCLESLIRIDPTARRLETLLEQIRAARGLLAISMHPQPHQSANARMLDFYERVLAILGNAQAVWRARQRDVAERLLGGFGSRGGGPPTGD